VVITLKKKSIFSLLFAFVRICMALLYVMTFNAETAYALRESKDTAIDKRIKVMVYNPDDVFKYVGYYGYQANIEFSPSETVDSVSMGDTTAWQIVPAGHRIFLKPIESDATTNMTVITNKYTYYFELHAKEAEDINDPGMIFTLRFLYPDESSGSVVKHFASTSGPDLSEPEHYNFDYTMSGSDKIAPLKIFDDGEFTYMEFKNKNAEMPAFFVVDADGHEALVNYHMAGKYVVLERVESRLTLRHGKDVICVFNEAMPLDSQVSE
jgi:type IV secretion system protein VirB9